MCLGVREPDTVGTRHPGASPRGPGAGGGGGRGAAGGTGRTWTLLLLFSLCRLLTSSSTTNFSAALLGLLNFSHSILIVRDGGICLFFMILLTGMTLLDRLLRQNMAVEIMIVISTIMPMTPASTPKAFMGLSLVCIKKVAIGPLWRVCKGVQRKHMTYSRGQTVTQKFHLSKICYIYMLWWKLSLKKIKYESHTASPVQEWRL